jgi:hypothetical protein
MLGIEKFITKEGSKFYLDLMEWGQESDIGLDNGDIIKFSYEGKKYTAKVENFGNSNSSVLELSILKELQCDN